VDQSRFSEVSRRAFFGGVNAAAILGLAACTNDSQLAGTTSGSTTSDGRPQGGMSGGPGGKGGPATTTAGSAKPGANGGGGAALPASAKAEIAFTYAATGNGMQRNPYIAVWIEDGSGALVQTVSLWHLQRQDRWLNELKRWYQVSGGSDTGSSATRVAGSYTVAWDGSVAGGGRATAADYYVCIESAREHGTYSLVREKVTFGTSGAKTSLGDNGDLSKISVSYTV